MEDFFIKNQKSKNLFELIIKLIFVCSQFPDQKRNSLLSVENFQEIDQDVGKGSFHFRRALDCFKQARDSLYYPSQHPIKSYLGMFVKVDDFIKERYRTLNKFNEKLK